MPHVKTIAAIICWMLGPLQYSYYANCCNPVHEEERVAARFNPCGSYNLLGEGIIQSPNYPDYYPNDITCLWNLEASPVDGSISLRFTNFSTEPERDILVITDDNGSVYSFSGFGLPTGTVPLGKRAVIRFTTDVGLQSRGFRIVFTTKVYPCDSLVIGEGTLQFPKSHYRYNNEIICNWTLKPFPEVGLLHLNFENSRISGDPYVLDINEDGSLPRRFSGLDLPSSLLLRKETRITYRTHFLLQDTGTIIKFSTTGHPCGRLVYGSGLLQSDNYPGMYPNGVRCVWNLVASHGGYIFLQFLSFDIFPPTDFLEIHADQSVLRYSRDKPPPLTLGRTASVYFLTMNSDRHLGFRILFTTENDECSLLGNGNTTNTGCCRHAH